MIFGFLLLSFTPISSSFQKKSLLRPQFLQPLTANHAGDADDDEGDAEQLSHVERHAVLETDLSFLGELDEETGHENQRQAQTEIETGTDRQAGLGFEV